MVWCQLISGRDIQKNKGVTSKEAFNLLEGRSVHKNLVNKDNVEYQAWLKLDFDQTDKHGNFLVKHYTEGYGYDLQAAVAKYPVKELADEKQKEDLVKSLQKGNVQMVTMTVDGKEEKMFLSANPQYKSVDIYDGKMNKVRMDENKTQGKEATASKKGEHQPNNVKAANKKGNKTTSDLMPQADNIQKTGKKIK